MKRFALQTILLFFALLSYGQSNRLAILDLCERNNETNKENLASAIHMAEVAGMSYIITTIVSEAVSYPFVLVTSSLIDGTLQTGEIQTLNNFVNNGGILIAPYIKDAVYFNLFGISNSSYATSRYKLVWNTPATHPELSWINDDLEKVLPLARPDYSNSISTRGYTIKQSTILAFFEDNSAAITVNKYGQGKAYALGFQLKDVVLRNLLNKDYSAQRTWSNGFEPTTDMFLLFLRAVYTSNKAVSIYKHTSPENSTSTLMITHDVDSRTGMDSMYYFSEWEESQGIKAHYFVTTHYLKDSHMSAYYDDKSIPQIRSLLEHGHIVGSHSVGHFPDFDSRSVFPEGVAGNTTENYRPVNENDVTSGGTVAGELEVSRDLLNNECGANVRSFRAGYLAFNTHLINVMADLGFAFNSTHSANDVLTNFPYRQRTSSAFSGNPTDVYEIPMSISDASKTLKLTEETEEIVVPNWIDILKKNDDNNAPTVLLIHPNRGWKLDALKSIIAAKPASVMTYDLDAFGDYWLERRDLDYDYSITNNKLSVKFVNDAAIGEAQSFVITNGRNLESIELLNHSGEHLAFQSENWNANDVIITHIGGSIVIIPEPKQFTLVINSKDENGQNLFDVNWQVLSADSTLIGEGNTGSNALDTLIFANTNTSIALIIKTNKVGYADYRTEFNIPAEQIVSRITTNSLIKYLFQLEVTAKDSETGIELDSILVKAYLNGILLMQGESLGNTLAELETTQVGHSLDLDLIIERNGYITTYAISTTLIDEKINERTYSIVKVSEPEPIVIDHLPRLAIIDLTDRNGETDKENLASAQQMADVGGVPYLITTSLEAAVESGFMLLTSEIKSTTLSSSELTVLKNWVMNGGTLIAPFVNNSDLFELFGVTYSKLDKYRYSFNWSDNTAFKELKWIDDINEKSIPLAKSDYYKSIDTRGYTTSTAETLAIFEDNTVAVSRNDFGQGKAYAFGVEWKDVILRNLLDKDYNAQRTYSNGFEPTTDVFMLVLRAIFTENQEVSVYKHTSPGESTSALLITHDVDSRTVIDTMNYFSNWEFIQGISAHYFVTTHYFKDSQMSLYYEDSKFEKIKELLARNHTIGSHSVSHSPDFEKTSVFPMGSPGNTQYSYQPYYDGSQTVGGTVYGELEVSRDLLNNDIGANVRSFRAGELAFNPRIVEVMEELGYAFNSSMSANNVLTNFPYMQRTNKAFSGTLANILEIPLTLSDVSSENKLESNNIDEVVSIWTDVINRNNRNNAPSSLILSTNRGWKLVALQNLMLSIPSSVITYNFEDFGDYWLDRQALDFDYSLSEGILTIVIKSEVTPAEDLSLVVENGANISQVIVSNAQGSNVSHFVKGWNTSDLLITFGQPQQTLREKSVATIDVPTLIKEAQFNLFPNPAKGFVNLLFDMGSKEEYTIRITEMRGRQVFSYEGIANEGSSMHRIDLSSYTRGIYLVNFESASVHETLKLSVID